MQRCVCASSRFNVVEVGCLTTTATGHIAFPLHPHSAYPLQQDAPVPASVGEEEEGAVVEEVVSGGSGKRKKKKKTKKKAGEPKPTAFGRMVGSINAENELWMALVLTR